MRQISSAEWPLRSHPTLSHFENARTAADLVRVGAALLETAVAQLPRATRRVAAFKQYARTPIILHTHLYTERRDP